MLRQSMKMLVPDPEALLDAAGIAPTLRGEVLSVQDFARLAYVTGALAVAAHIAATGHERGARHTRKPRIGLALGSGSARGWSHIGVIEALAEAASNPTSSRLLDRRARGRRGGNRQAFRNSRPSRCRSNWREIARLMDVRLSSGGLVEGGEVVAVLRSLGISGDIEKAARAYVAVATDLRSGREIWMREGPIETAVRASISLPGIFSPAQRDGHFLVDGGLRQSGTGVRGPRARRRRRDRGQSQWRSRRPLRIPAKGRRRTR